jgi:hypothetical protein
MRHFDRILIVEPEECPFDRGWVKNAGFLLSLAGPSDSIYFHDVDTLPIAPNWTYPCVPRGSIQHLYGHNHCLGGIVGVDPAVFAYLRGFSHSKTWGGEDRHFQIACLQHDITIHRGVSFHSRFHTASVVELHENGTIQSHEQIKQDMQNKIMHNTFQRYDTGKLSLVQFKVRSLAKLNQKVFHYIIREIK